MDLAETTQDLVDLPGDAAGFLPSHLDLVQVGAGGRKLLNFLEPGGGRGSAVTELRPPPSIYLAVPTSRAAVL